MATIQLTNTKFTKNKVMDLLWQYLDMKFPHHDILHSTTDDKIFVFHGHQIKVIEWLVNHQIEFVVLDYEQLNLTIDHQLEDF